MGTANRRHRNRNASSRLRKLPGGAVSRRIGYMPKPGRTSCRSRFGSAERGDFRNSGWRTGLSTDRGAVGKIGSRAERARMRRPAQEGTHHPGRRMMSSRSYTIHPTDDPDPCPAGPEARQLDIQPNRSTNQQTAALADAISRYQRWNRNLERIREERRLARREKREEAAA